MNTNEQKKQTLWQEDNYYPTYLISYLANYPIENSFLSPFGHFSIIVGAFYGCNYHQTSSWKIKKLTRYIMEENKNFLKNQKLLA